MLEVRELFAGYGESLVLQGATLSVREGQVAAVLGRNGVGKTTLMPVSPPERASSPSRRQAVRRRASHAGLRPRPRRQPRRPFDG